MGVFECGLADEAGERASRHLKSISTVLLRPRQCWQVQDEASKTIRTLAGVVTQAEK